MSQSAVGAVRVCAGLLLALLLMPLGAGIAAAHGGGVEAPPAGSLPRVLAVEPPVPGLAVVVIDGGARLRIDNGTGVPVAVLPDGRPLVPPGGSAAWADARLGDPAAIPPGDPAAWAVPLSVGGQPVTVRGDRTWPAPPHPFPWWALTVAALLGTVAVGEALTEPGWRRGARIALAAVTLAVVAAYVVHVAGSSLVLAEPPGAVALIAATGLGLACVLLGPVAAALTLRGSVVGPALCGPVGFLAALLTVVDTTAFHRPVLAFGWAPDLDRATIVITVGAGLGLLAVAVRTMRRTETPPRPPVVGDARPPIRAADART